MDESIATELFELCDLNLDEDDPVLHVQQALRKLGEAPGGVWPGCGPLGRTPLHALCANADCDPAVGETTARLLLASGVPVDQRDKQGNTSLHVLCTSDHTAAGAVALAHVLLDAGAGCTLEDAAGRTPCSLAEGGEVSGSWRDDRDGSEDTNDTGPSQPELADLLRRRMILSHHGLGHRIVSRGLASESVVVADKGRIRRPSPPPPVASLLEPEPEHDPPETPRLTVLLIGPGSGRSSSPSLFGEIESYHSVECPELQEPEDDLEECVSHLTDTIERFSPDLIVCRSRGAIILSQLVSRSFWRGPSLLLGAVRTIECICSAQDGNELEYFGAPLTIYHGTEDEIQRIVMVRDEVRCLTKTVVSCPHFQRSPIVHASASIDHVQSSLVCLCRELSTKALAAPEVVQLIEASGEGHALASLSSDGLLSLLQKAYEWGSSPETRMAAAAEVGQDIVEAARERLTARFRQVEQMSAFVRQIGGRMLGEMEGDEDHDDEGWSD